ncbi:MAG: hypothetical protein JNK78_20620 [Planctomycetes bacterium]|nr:hypothetical protein [Planctomycetota bacterium]
MADRVTPAASFATHPLLAALTTFALAQEPTTPRPVPPRSPALQRAVDDATVALGKLTTAPHAFAGTCDSALPDIVLPKVVFTAARDGELSYFTVADHRVLQHGDQVMVSKANGPWSRPEGDAPECPWEPAMLARRLATAVVQEHAVTEFEGRPAIRIHLAWTNDAARRVIDDASHPTTRFAAILENIGRHANDAGEHLVVDACVVFDPATKVLYGCALRVEVMEPKASPSDEEEAEKAPHPLGLPALPRRPAAYYVMTVAMRPVGEVPLPPLDESLRSALGVTVGPQQGAKDEPVR